MVKNFEKNSGMEIMSDDYENDVNIVWVFIEWLVFIFEVKVEIIEILVFFLWV